MNPSHWLKELRFRLFYSLITRRRFDLVTLGDECPWTIRDSGLGPESKVLSGGAGNDVSFEKALIAKYGCQVVLCDPSPTGVATVNREQLPPDGFSFRQIGLAGVDGMLEFHEPHDPSEGSFVGGAGRGSSPALKFPCISVPTLMAELGWSHLDLLKIDIEGFEFPVLQDVIGRRLNVRQICVEFHHGPQFSRSRSETARTILMLRRAGYDLVHRVNWDHTFLRRKA